MNTADLADLLGRLARHYWVLQRHAEGINPNVGILRIIDGTYIKLPANASNWTAISKVSSGIKLHIRVVVASSNSVFPEKMIPSTGNIADSDAVNHIIGEDALYVMDRGYAHKTKMDGWVGWSGIYNFSYVFEKPSRQKHSNHIHLPFQMS